MWIRLRRAPRAFLTILLGTIAVLVVALGLLGWRLLDQDRALEHQRVQERLESAADASAALLRQSFRATEEHLATLAATADPSRVDLSEGFSIKNKDQDAVVIVLTPTGLWSSAPLLFYPDEPDPVDAVAAAFAGGERVEISGDDLPSALATFRRLATEAADSRVRAGAWLRVARVARKLEQPHVALAAYDELARLGSVPAAGRPADLMARVERCVLFDHLGQRAELTQAAADLEAALHVPGWRLSRGEYYFYLGEIARWLGRKDAGTGAPPETAAAEALATGVALAWQGESGLTSPASPVSGNRTGDANGTPVLIVWRRAADRVTAIVATPAYAARTWFRDMNAVGERQRAHVALTSEAGQPWFGPPDDAANAARRSPSELDLPFTLRVASSDPVGDAAMFTSRRRLQAGLLITLALLLIAGGIVVARGVGKELEVARLQSDFVAAVSHEFRTPVASVRQLSSLLDEGRVRDDERKAQYYGLLRRESERLERLVEGLLDFGRMESAAKEYRFDEQLETAAFVKAVAGEFEAGSGRGDHRLVLSMAEALPMIRADREALGRAIWNLLDNAAKYSPPDTTIHLDVKASGEVVVIRVRDEGPGIAPDEQRRIFDKFVRGTSARATGAKGTGLGLAMVAHIVRAHGGEVKVESQPGAGATFTIVLPRAESSSERKGEA